MSELTERISRVLREHQERALMNYDSGREECRCGEQGDQPWAAHVASAVEADLALTEVPGWLSTRGGVLHHAVVGWSEVQQ